MRAFEEMVGAAQVGVGKAPPGEGVLGAGASAVLELGALGLMRRAGKVGSPQAPLPATPPESRQVARASAGALDEAFALKEEEAVFEWVDAAARAGFVAPPEALPALLAMPKRSRRRTLPALGERGRWLAGLMGVALDERTEDDPEAARATLREEFETMDFRALVRAIGVVGQDPRPEDGALLGPMMGDRRKEVRAAAGDALARLPDSPPARELRALAEGILVAKSGLLRRSLEVVPPDAGRLPPWLPRIAARTGLGPGALALLDVARRVPPRVWSETTGMVPSEIVERVGKGDYAVAFHEAWQEAALRFGDAEWTDELFRRLDPVRPELLSRVSAATFEAVLLKRLQNGGATAALGTIVARDRSLSPALSLAVVEAARSAKANPMPYYGATFLLDLSVLPLLEETWEENDDLRQHWRKLLDLRRRLLESLR